VGTLNVPLGYTCGRMKSMRRLVVVALTLAAASMTAGTARAQGYFSVSYGYSYGGAAGDCPSVWHDCPNRPSSWGIATGSAGKILGIEGEYGWTSDFFGKGADLEGSKVTTIMSTFLIGVPLGPVRPYGAAGLGFVKTSLEFKPEAHVSNFSDTSWGLNYGAGVMIFLPAHIGFRIDYRRFSSSVEIPYVGPIARSSKTLEFSRATIGFILH
jgi:opacity protein-like surface antigen